MTTFTEDQIKILTAAFDHVWTRVEAIAAYNERDALRLDTMAGILETNKVLTRKHRLEIAKSKDTVVSGDALTPDCAVELKVTERILQGDVSAFLRLFEQEEEEGSLAGFMLDCELEGVEVVDARKKGKPSGSQHS